MKRFRVEFTIKSGWTKYIDAEDEFEADEIAMRMEPFEVMEDGCPDWEEIEVPLMPQEIHPLDMEEDDE